MTTTPSRLAALAADLSAAPAAAALNGNPGGTASADHQVNEPSSSSSSSSSSSESETDASNDTYARDPSALLARLTASLTCTICNELFLRPHALACGHTFCFPCASNWLATAKRRCPLCRTRVLRRPCFVYPLAEAVAHVRGTLVEAGGGEIVREDEMQVWERLFGKDVAGGVIADTEDGVRRCFNCHWEIVGHECAHCGMHYDSDDFAAEAAQGVQDADGSTDGGDMSGEDIGYPTDDDDDNVGPILLDELGDADENEDESDSESARHGRGERRRRRRHQEQDEDEMDTEDEQFLADDDEVEFDSDASESAKREYFARDSGSDRRRRRRRERKEKKRGNPRGYRDIVELLSSDAEVLTNGQGDGDDAGWESADSLMDVDPPVSSRRGRHAHRSPSPWSESELARPPSTKRIAISTDDDEDVGADDAMSDPDAANRSPVAASSTARTGTRRIVVLDDEDDDEQGEQGKAPTDASATPPLAVVFSSGESDEERADVRSGYGSSSSSSSSSGSGSSSSSSDSNEHSSRSGSESDDERSEGGAQQFVGQTRKRRSKQGGGGRRVGFKRHRRH